MGIEVQNQPNPALLGQAAFSAGLGDYAKYNQQLQIQQTQLDQAQQSIDQRDRLQAAQIAAAKQEQMATLLAQRSGQELSLDAQRQMQTQQLAGQQANLKTQLIGQRSNLEFTTEAEKQAQLRTFQQQSDIARFTAAQENARLQAQLASQQSIASTQAMVSRMNNVSSIAGDYAQTQAKLVGQQQQAFYDNYARQQQIAQQGDIQSQLSAQGFGQQQGLAAQGFDSQQQLQQSGQQLGIDAYRQQQQIHGEQQTANASDLFNLRQSQIQSSIEQVQGFTASDGWSEDMKAEAIRQLQLQQAGIDKVKQLRQSPYPEGQGPGEIFPMTNPDTKMPFLDPQGNPIPFTRDQDGNVSVVRGYKMPMQLPQAKPMSPLDIANYNLKVSATAEKAVSDAIRANGGSAEGVDVNAIRNRVLLNGAAALQQQMQGGAMPQMQNDAIDSHIRSVENQPPQNPNTGWTPTAPWTPTTPQGMFNQTGANGAGWSTRTLTDGTKALVVDNQQDIQALLNDMSPGQSRVIVLPNGQVMTLKK